jgi:hypothetical protein
MQLVYFIQMLDDHLNPIKIGKSKEPKLRFEQAITHSPYPLSFLGVVSDVDESVLHTRFKEQRLEGEWFVPSEEMVTFIEENCSEGDFSSKRSTVHIERYDVVKEMCDFYNITLKEFLNMVLKRYISKYANRHISNSYFKGEQHG